MAVEIGALRAMLSLDSAAFEKGAKRAQASMNGLQRSMAKASDRMGRIGRQMTTRVTAPLAAAAGLMARSAVTAAFEIERLAQVSDAGTTEFQRFAAGAREVGIQQEKLADILKDTQDRVGDFLATGGGPMADFFENIAPKVGVTAEQFAKLSGPEALQLYVSSLEEAGVSQQQMTFYMEALASDATLLLPLLRDNGAEMQRLGDRAQRLGEVMDSQTITALNGARETMRDMRAAGVGLRNEIIVALAPAMERIAEVLQGVVGWFRELSPRTRRFAVAVTALGAAAGPAAIALGAVAAALSVINLPLVGLAALATAGAGALVLLSGDTGKYEKAAKAAEGAQKALNAAMGTFYETSAPSSAREAINAANANYQLAESALAAAEAEIAKFEAARQNMREGFEAMGGGLSMEAEARLSAERAALERQRMQAEAALEDAKRARDRAARSVTSAMDLGVIDVNGGGANDLKVQVEGLGDALKGIGGGGGAAEAAQRALSRMGQAAGDAASSGLDRLDRGLESVSDAMARAIVQGKDMGTALARVFDQIATDLLSSGISQLIGGGSSGGGGLFGSLLSGLVGPGMTTGTPLTIPAGGAEALLPPSFAGGGYTGDGPRTGGLDGRGGFPAILHPRETVVDHTQGGGGGTQRIDVRVYVDEDGQWQGRVEQIAGDVTQRGLAAYDRQLPGRVQQSLVQGRNRRQNKAWSGS